MLLNKLKEYVAGNVYPMHMPGHKRNKEHGHGSLPFDFDITEINGFDDMHNPLGILLEIQKLASKLYESKNAFTLVNGSTVGILAAIGAHTKRKDKILIGKNHHWSVDNAVSLFDLNPIYITPGEDEETGLPLSIPPEMVEEALAHDPDIALIVITSPSYEGVVSDVASIAEIAHSKDIPLFVDSAHGAHLGFSKMFPKSAIQAGADIVVMSLHKTLPAMTQCSLLHICTDRANNHATGRMLSMLQTSSPSYVLMASIDGCLHLLENDHVQLFSDYERKLERFGDEIKHLKHLQIPCHQKNISNHFFDFDPGKLVVITKNTKLTGELLLSIMRNEYSIELEKAFPDYALAMTSISDSAEGFDRFAEALLDVDHKLNGSI